MRFLVYTALFLGCSAACWADVIEFVTGSKVEGTVTARDEQSITITTTLAGRELTRKYPLDRIAAITIGDRREVLNAAGQSGTPASKPGGGSSKPAVAATAGKSRAEIEALIEQTGKTKPEWWDSVQVNYPQTLDLSWPDKPGGKWDNQRNVGQYIWDVINTNQSKWHEGVRFMHHLLTVHQNDPAKLAKVMRELGRMYQDLLRDYPRAAFWWRQSGAGRGTEDYDGIQLAECYWRMGNKAMAVETLKKTPNTFSAVKLWADMGETAYALQMAESVATGEWADMALLLAGDACRVAGQHEKAVGYYKRILALPAVGRAQKRILRSQQRAQANLEGIRLFDSLDLRRVPDGTYRGASLGFEAPVQIEVVVRSNRIESVRVVEHHEKQYYAAMIETPAKIIAKQSVKGIDTTSRATITSEAIINATAKALSSAMK